MRFWFGPVWADAETTSKATCTWPNLHAHCIDTLLLDIQMYMYTVWSGTDKVGDCSRKSGFQFSSRSTILYNFYNVECPRPFAEHLIILSLWKSTQRRFMLTWIARPVSIQRLQLRRRAIETPSNRPDQTGWLASWQADWLVRHGVLLVTDLVVVAPLRYSMVQ